jgi:hypothetical protein
MIYFIAVKKRVKIGYSLDPKRRLKELQAANGLKLRLLAVVPGTKATEAALHYVFRDVREMGEWFRYSGLLKSCIIALKDKENLHFQREGEFSVRTFQKAGCHLRVRQIANATNQKGKESNLYKETKFFKRSLGTLE